jgi:hypothetical protein
MVCFPGPSEMDVDQASADMGWRNGVWVANGNLVARHLGIPTVSVPMGTMSDTGMPVGLIIAGRAYDDTAPLILATAFEATGSRRKAPPGRHGLNDFMGRRLQSVQIGLAVTFECWHAKYATPLSTHFGVLCTVSRPSGP